MAKKGVKIDKNCKKVRKNAKTFENVQKYSKSCAKRLKIFEKLCEMFENIQKFEQFFPPRRHEGTKKKQPQIC
jgi:hypothetical protein